MIFSGYHMRATDVVKLIGFNSFRLFGLESDDRSIMWKMDRDIQWKKEVTDAIENEFLKAGLGVPATVYIDIDFFDKT